MVRTTAEVVLGADDRLRFDREPDPHTGYDELVVRRVEDPSGMTRRGPGNPKGVPR